MLLWPHSTGKTCPKQQRKENNWGNLLDQLKNSCPRLTLRKNLRWNKKTTIMTFQKERKCSERWEKSFCLLLTHAACWLGWQAGQAERVTHWKVEPVFWLRRGCAQLRILSIFGHKHYSSLMWIKRGISQGQYWIFARAAFLLKLHFLWSLCDLTFFYLAIRNSMHSTRCNICHTSS